jgi:hypothetical protein
MLIFPEAALNRITHSLKNFTAVKANQILQRTGRPFWQDESFDHWVRNRIDLEKIQSYIENNPVKAGLVKRSEDWPWSASGTGLRPAQQSNSLAQDRAEGQTPHQTSQKQPTQEGRPEPCPTPKTPPPPPQ